MIEHFYQPDSAFVFTRVSGVVTDADTRNDLNDLNLKTSDRRGLLELTDCRGVQDVASLSVSGLVSAAELERGQSRVAGGKLAIVVASPLHYGLARAFTSISSNFREAVAVFYDFEEALVWLLPPQDVESARDFIATCPPPAGSAS